MANDISGTHLDPGEQRGRGKRNGLPRATWIVPGLVGGVAVGYGASFIGFAVEEAGGPSFFVIAVVQVVAVSAPLWRWRPPFAIGVFLGGLIVPVFFQLLFGHL